MASNSVAYNFPNAQWPEHVYSPLRDESGKAIRWYDEAADIDDETRLEEQLRNENFVLREEID